MAETLVQLPLFRRIFQRRKDGRGGARAEKPDSANERGAAQGSPYKESLQKTSVFFIVGCARSGTTSLCQILDRSPNAECRLEPAPNLNRESRELMEGRLPDPYRCLTETLGARIPEVLDRGLVYGEKNVTLAPFMPYIARMYRAAFVFVKRDGRDVVRSLINWHNELFGTVYRECKEPGDLSARARAFAEGLPPELDMSDYARPRPGPDDIWRDRWPEFSRLEMCAWYWSRINELIMDELEELPVRSWHVIDYTNPKADDVLAVARFLGLEGLSREEVERMVQNRINSLETREGLCSRFPKWTDWADSDRVAFENIAARTMQRLGYYEPSHVRFCPSSYGRWWKENSGGLEWYQWMYRERLAAHEDLYRFIEHVDATEGRVSSMLDVGCGMGVGYAERYRDRRYMGIDLSHKEVEWCRNHRGAPGREYRVADIIQERPEEKFDLVFSQGTIDNVYDMNEYLRQMVRCARRWIYVTAYRGWFPDLPEHRYSWSEDTTCFYNDLSPAETRQVLQEMGCTDVDIRPLRMPGREIPYETRITARVPG